MLLLLLLVAGVTNTLAANVTVSPTTGKLIAAKTGGYNETGAVRGWSAMWRHEQLNLTLTVSDFPTLTPGDELATPAGNICEYQKNTTIGNKLVLAGGQSYPGYMVLSLPKGYKITGYKIVFLNNLDGSTVKQMTGVAQNKTVYETNKLFETESAYANTGTMSGNSDTKEYTLERNSENDESLGNQLYFKIEHSATEYFLLTIKSFEVFFSAEGTFNAEVAPTSKGAAKSLVTIPFTTSKLDLGPITQFEGTSTGGIWSRPVYYYGYDYTKVTDLPAYNYLYQEDAVLDGVPADVAENKNIYPLTVDGQTVFGFGNDTYFVETPTKLFTSTGLSTPIGYRIVGAVFTPLWSTTTVPSTTIQQTGYYITNGGNLFLTDDLHFSRNSYFKWEVDEQNRLKCDKGYLACQGTGNTRTLSFSSVADNIFNLRVEVNDGTNYIYYISDSGNKYYLRKANSASTNPTVVLNLSSSNRAEADNTTLNVTVPAFNPGSYTLTIYEPDGKAIEKTLPVNGATEAYTTTSKFNNDAIKFKISGLENGKQALLSITLLMQALDPYIDKMDIVCSDANNVLELKQTFSANDFSVSGGKFVFYVPEDYGNQDLTFTFSDLYSNYGDETYYGNTNSVNYGRYSFVTSPYFVPIDGYEDNGLYDAAYNAGAPYTNKVYTSTAGNVRFKFNNAEDLKNDGGQTGTSYLMEYPFSVSQYLQTYDPDVTSNPEKANFISCVLNASKDEQKSDTYYVFTADETRYNIAPGSKKTVDGKEVSVPHAWEHRSYAFYRMDIELRAKTFTPNISVEKVYDKTCYVKDGNDVEDSMWKVTLDTSDTEDGVKVDGYLSVQEILDNIKGREASDDKPAIVGKLDPNNVNGPASMKQILCMDATNLVQIVKSKKGNTTLDLQTLRNEMAANSLIFMPENTTSIIDNVAFKTTSGSFRAGRHIVLNDKQPFYTPYDIRVDGANYATYTREYTTDAYGKVTFGTVMLPFTVSVDDKGEHTNVAGVPGAGGKFTVNVMKNKQEIAVEKGVDYGTAYFAPLTGEETTVANTPYMINVTADPTPAEPAEDDETGTETESNVSYIVSEKGALIVATTGGVVDPVVTDPEDNKKTTQAFTGKYYVGEEAKGSTLDKGTYDFTNKGSYSGGKFDRAISEDVFYFARDRYINLHILSSAKRYLYSYPFRSAYTYTASTSGAKQMKGFFVSFDELQGGTTGIDKAISEIDLMIRAGKGTLSLTATRAQDVTIHALSGMRMERVQLNAGESHVVSLPAGIYVVNGTKIVVK